MVKLREPLVGVKRRKPSFELPSEQLSEIFQRVGTDGVPPLQKEGYKITGEFSLVYCTSPERMKHIS